MAPASVVMPSMSLGGRNVRFIQFKPPDIFGMHSLPEPGEVTLFFGADVLNGSSVTAKNFASVHTRYARDGLATRIIQSGVKIKGFHNTNSLWFHSVLGMFKATFQYQSLKTQEDCLQKLQGLWLSQWNVACSVPAELRMNLKESDLATVNNRDVQAQHDTDTLGDVCTTEYYIETVVEGDPMSNVYDTESDRDISTDKDTQSLEITGMNDPERTCDDDEDDNVETVYVELMDYEKEVMNGDTSADCSSLGIDDSCSVTGELSPSNITMDASWNNCDTNSEVCDIVFSTEELDVTCIPEEEDIAVVGSTETKELSKRICCLCGHSMNNVSDLKTILAHVHCYLSSLVTRFETRSKDSYILGLVLRILNFYQEKYDAGDECDFIEDIVSSYIDYEWDSSSGRFCNNFGIPQRTNFALCLVSECLGKKFQALIPAILEHVKQFKEDHIDHIDNLPPPHSLVGELFPQCMQMLLLTWMGQPETGCTEEHTYAMPPHPSNVYPFVQLILEFANNSLITGVAHVLYTRLLQDNK